MQERQHGYDKADLVQPAAEVEDASQHRRSSEMSAPDQPVASGLIMRKGDAGMAAHAETAVAHATSSAGSSLPGPLMRKFESSLGADLSSVRVHTGSESATAASSVGARAYATGQDIHFGAGQYDPSSSGGQHLLAHEVAHTVQQRGGASSRQHKLEVSSPHDAAEHEADRAADAMVAGTPAAVSSGGLAIARKPVDPSTGDLQGAGDEAQHKAWQTPLQVDTLSVQTDRSRVGEVIADIKSQQKNVDALVKADANVEAQRGPQAKNTETLSKLSVLDTKLDVTNVDTAAFSSQYRYSHADYQRLVAEANEYLTLQNRNGHRTGGDPLGVVAGEHDEGPSSAGIKVDSSSQSERFRAARKNLNTAATKMDSQMTKVRGAANSLQGAILKAQAAAAAAAGAAAAGKLAAVNAEIASVAAGVSTVVKIASAVGGLAGGAGATNALGTAKASSEGGGAHIGVSDFAAQTGIKGQNVVTPEEHSKAALAVAMGKDAASVFGSGGDPATALVTAIGQHANKGKIATLQAAITKAAAEEATFKAAGESLQMVGYQQTLEGEAGSLMVLQQAFVSAKLEVRAAGDDLMAVLNKGGAKGKKQARSVLFLTDADRFLAQVEMAISAGRNQQVNLKNAAADRRGLRGTSAANHEQGDDAGAEAGSQYYYRCSRIESKGVIYGTNTTYKLDRVFVRFQDNGTLHQGGKGTIEGAGSADDEVALKITTLQTAKKQVQDLQTKIQTALGLGAPGLNA
ncbi:hypothetical protein BH11MYX1_BH11MYX1_08870 [soil metagenome]